MIKRKYSRLTSMLLYIIFKYCNMLLISIRNILNILNKYQQYSIYLITYSSLDDVSSYSLWIFLLTIFLRIFIISISNNISIRKITTMHSDIPITMFFTSGNSLLSLWSGVAVGVALWNTINGMSTAIIIMNVIVCIYNI